LQQYEHAGEGREGEPQDARLPVGQDDEGGKQRPYGGAEVAADLEHRLGETVAAPRGHARHARGLRVKHRGAGTDQSGRAQQQSVAVRIGEQRQAGEGEGHAGGERIGPGTRVGVAADQRLQDGGRDLVGEGHDPDLPEGQVVTVLEHGIQRRQQRLHHIVEQMTEADCGQHRERGLAGGARAVAGNGVVQDASRNSLRGLCRIRLMPASPLWGAWGAQSTAERRARPRNAPIQRFMPDYCGGLLPGL
jgi:hypothetical protein